MTHFFGFAEKLYETARPLGISVINIESSQVHVANELFGDCGCLLEGGLVSNCTKCGRAAGNNVRFLSGKGDGLYVGFEFLDLQSYQPVAWCLILDEGNAAAKEAWRRVSSTGSESENLLHATGIHQFFNEVTEPYWDLPCARAGDVAPNANLGLVISDAAAGRNSPFAQMFTEQLPDDRGTFSVYLACEPILDRPEVTLGIRMGMSEESFTGGFAESQRPRVVFIVSSTLAGDLPDHPALAGHDWIQQAEAWRHTQVDSHVSEVSAEACLLNGLYCLQSGDALAEGAQDTESEAAARLYFDRALAWFARGSHLGHAECRSLLRDTVRSFDAQYADVEKILKDWLDRWGWDYTPELARSLKETISG